MKLICDGYLVFNLDICAHETPTETGIINHVKGGKHIITSRHHSEITGAYPSSNKYPFTDRLLGHVRQTDRVARMHCTNEIDGQTDVKSNQL